MRRGVKITVWVVAILGVLIVLPGLAFSIPFFTVLLWILVGWIHYLSDVLPRITVSKEGLLLLALCLVLAGIVGHGFCRWLWQGTAHDTPWRPRWTVSGLALLVLMFAAGTAFTGAVHQTGWILQSPESLTRGEGAERSVVFRLKTIASAQADFRGNDRDENKVLDFWRADIAGLYTLKPAGRPEPIKLIDLSTALADDRPATDLRPYGEPGPTSGYRFRALRFEGETSTQRDPDRFAACGFPVSPSAGRWIFIISQENVIYRKPFTGSPPEVYPVEPAKEGWTKLD